ncbi:T9SS type A sorting domain-containing protein [Candidatus Poribacteria bacterium]|nr:T9SS type A sorting domain-containing protein [Candidatus Poribacteria bacterium]
MATPIKLEAIFPSPANPEAWIPYKLSKSADVKISVYNASGQLIRVLNLGTKEVGQYLKKDKAAYWDGRNEAGERVSSGVYFCVIQAGGFSDAKKMVVSK